MRVYITKCETSEIPPNLVETRIAHKNGSSRVRFFLDSISENSIFKGMPEDGELYATFFKESEFEISWVARIQNDINDSNKNNISKVIRGLYIPENFVSDIQVKKISKFIRDSETLKHEDIRYTSKNSGFILDSGSFGYISTNTGQFYRILFLKMLALSYISIIEKQNLELRKPIIKQNCNKTSSNIELYRNIKSIYESTLLFNAAFYQKFPVKSERQELPKIWAEIDSAMGIDDRHSEMNESLSALTEWLRTEEDREAAQAREESREQRRQEQAERIAQEARREAALNKRSYIISIFLAVISVLLAILALPQLN